ncbi:MAG: beta-N-acetylhexosaminidase [Paraprevotella sp.]|nr:beta-N-acetylhexosaminidase [Paraprevotella sp.]
MKRPLLLLLLTLLHTILTPDAAKAEGKPARYPLIPYPSSLRTTAEGRLPLNRLTAITCPTEELKATAESFATRLKATAGIRLSIAVQKNARRKPHTIHLRTDKKLGPEAYTLTVYPDGIELTASRPAGFFYGLQTLTQFLPTAIHGTTLQEDSEWSVPYVAIADEPLLTHRGYMLDIARHYFGKPEMKRILDLMAFYKMNRLHWHLTDDQGWRIEIPEYPKLTEVGSRRAGSFINCGDNRKFFDDSEYGLGLWYSLDDLREIVAYARERHIEILPEIDLPGHMMAAITAYPELSCDVSRKYQVRVDGGISHDVLNIGDDRVIDFLKCVLGHVAEVFPYPYIHLGGDECPTTQWSANADCLARVKTENLKGVNELQSWLVELLGEWLRNEHGKNIVVWDELLTHWNNDNKVRPVIMAWNNIDKSREAADKGFRSIVVPYQSLYLDMMQVPVDEADVNELYQGGWTDRHVNTLQTVYGVNPIASLEGQEDFCMGVQGNMWTETTHTVEQLEYQLLPRLLALAETGWLPAEKKDWKDFLQRLQSHDEIFDTRRFTYARHYIEPKPQSEAEKALQEATGILDVSLRGGVGYPATPVYDALKTACSELSADMRSAERLHALIQAIGTYKNAPVCQPEAGKTYRLISASTYYKRKYAGSAVYAADTTLRLHFTPRNEPAELWIFEPQEKDNTWLLRNLSTGRYVVLGNEGSSVALSAENGTVLRMDKATTANGTCTYVPGSVTLSAAEGYSPEATGHVKRLCAEHTATVITRDVPLLCSPGTWLIVETNH